MMPCAGTRFALLAATLVLPIALALRDAFDDGIASASEDRRAARLPGGGAPGLQDDGDRDDDGRDDDEDDGAGDAQDDGDDGDSRLEDIKNWLRPPEEVGRTAAPGEEYNGFAEVGDPVEPFGLKTAIGLNGCPGKIVSFEKGKDQEVRFKVELHGESFNIRPANLKGSTGFPLLDQDALFGKGFNKDEIGEAYQHGYRSVTDAAFWIRGKQQERAAPVPPERPSWTMEESKVETGIRVKLLADYEGAAKGEIGTAMQLVHGPTRLWLVEVDEKSGQIQIDEKHLQVLQVISKLQFGQVIEIRSLSKGFWIRSVVVNPVDPKGGRQAFRARYTEGDDQTTIRKIRFDKQGGTVPTSWHAVQVKLPKGWNSGRIGGDRTDPSYGLTYYVSRETHEVQYDPPDPPDQWELPPEAVVSPYDVLGVSEQATQEEITKAYKALALKWHPDKNPSNTYAEEMFKKVNSAKDFLQDVKKKQHYDDWELPRMKAAAITKLSAPPPRPTNPSQLWKGDMWTPDTARHREDGQARGPPPPTPGQKPKPPPPKPEWRPKEEAKAKEETKEERRQRQKEEERVRKEARERHRREEAEKAEALKQLKNIVNDWGKRGKKKDFRAFTEATERCSDLGIQLPEDVARKAQTIFQEVQEHEEEAERRREQERLQEEEAKRQERLESHKRRLREYSERKESHFSRQQRNMGQRVEASFLETGSVALTWSDATDAQVPDGM